MTEEAAEQQPHKKRRITRACDYCHRRSIRCRPSGHNGSCGNCATFNQPCTFERQAKRRGAPPRIANGENKAQTSASTSASLAVNNKPPHQVSRQQVSQDPQLHVDPGGGLQQPMTIVPHDRVVSDGPWRAPFIAGQAVIMDLVELYFEVVYPIFPIFHQPTFVRRVARAEYASDYSLFAVTMAVCALSSARVRDGAVFNPRWNLVALRELRPEVFHAEAIRQVYKDVTKADLNLLRAHVILALVAIQECNIRDMHQHLGRYHTIVAMGGLHDERNWPKGIGLIETEERRRTFWSTYTLDIFTSIVWGGVARSRERQSNVQYPAETDDDNLTEDGIAGELFTPSSTSPTSLLSPSATRSSQVTWMAGRTFVIDLYRIMEHVMMRQPISENSGHRHLAIHDVLHGGPQLPQDAIHENVMRMYGNLPICLKETNAITCNPKFDRFGFQAADIIATVYLLRIVLSASSGASAFDRCEIANEVVTAFLTIPPQYHVAISVPLLFHLGLIGQILGSALEQRLSDPDYRMIREVMVTMTQLLSNLEGLHASKGASQRLWEHIDRLDEYMASQRLDKSSYLENEMSSVSQPASSGPTESPKAVANGSTKLHDAFAESLFQLPPELLGDFADIFDFAQF